MAVITVGNEAIDRAGSYGTGNTVVDQNGPANGTGIIDTVEIYLATGGTVEVGIFYVVSGNTLSTRSYASLGTLPVGKSTITSLSLAVQQGDYIGFYTTNGYIERDTVGVGYWNYAGDKIPGDNTAFNSTATRTVSIKGTGRTLPTITSLTPNSGAIGSTVTIAGTTFGASQGTGSVTFNGVAATDITSWSDTEIVCKVPVGATTGNAVVTNDAGDASAGTLFTVAAMDSVWQRFLRNKKVLCIS
jgi:hypothetical protein